MDTSIEVILTRLEQQVIAHKEATSKAHNAMANKLEEVLVQTKLTNGRVNELEGWRERIRGSWAAIVIIAMLLGTLIGWVVTVSALR